MRCILTEGEIAETLAFLLRKGLPVLGAPGRERTGLAGGSSVGSAGGTQWEKCVWGSSSLSPPPAQLGNTSSSHYQGLTTNESPLVFPIWCIFSFSNSGVHQLLRPECCSLQRLHLGPRVGLCGFLKGNHLAPLTCSSWPSLGAPEVWRPRTAPKPSIFHSRN